MHDSHSNPDDAQPQEHAIDGALGYAAPGQPSAETGPAANNLKTQAIRFLLTGGLSAVVDLGLTALMNLLLGQAVVIARTVGFIFGTLTAYLLNRRWTFNADASLKRFLAVMLLYAVTFFINVGGQNFGQHLFEGWGWPQAVSLVVAFVISQGVATVINFVIQRSVIFKAV